MSEMSFEQMLEESLKTIHTGDLDLCATSLNTQGSCT